MLLVGGYPIPHWSTLGLRAPSWLVPAHVEIGPVLLMSVRTLQGIVCCLADISGFCVLKQIFFSKQKRNPIDTTIKGQTGLIAIM